MNKNKLRNTLGKAMGYVGLFLIVLITNVSEHFEQSEKAVNTTTHEHQVQAQ